MSDEIVIRPATRDDEEAIRRMRASASWAADYTTRAFAEMQLGRRLIFVADLAPPPVQTVPLGSAGQPLHLLQTVGTVQLLWTSEDLELADGQSVAHLSDLVVMPGFRRRGVARRLVEHVEQVAGARGYATMTLDVDDHQPANQELYTRWGYVFFRRSISPSGTWLNGMRKALKVLTTEL